METDSQNAVLADCAVSNGFSAGDAAPVLMCRDVSKAYRKDRPVLNHFNLNLPGGRIMGLLGPNGCGKTTLLKMVAGLLIPDEGEITVCGLPCGPEANRYVSFLPERPYFNPGMRVSELLNFFSDFYDDYDLPLAKSMLSDLSIKEDSRLKHLSKGTKEKVQLILVMARNARLYLLDEPIAGVDPAARDYILETILKRHSGNASIVITTHLIADIEPALDEFAFLGRDGQIIMSGNVREVTEQTGKSVDGLFREVFKC